MKKIDPEKLEQVKGKGKGFIEEFKSFILRGNVMDMAIGVIIGTAFTKIVNSLVNEIITPAISLLTGKMNIGNMFIALSNEHFSTIAEAKAAGVATINYGLFLSSIIDFLIVAFTIFLFLRYTFKKREKNVEVAEKVSPTKECPYCLSIIPEKATKCAFCTENLSTEKSVDK